MPSLIVKKEGKIYVVFEALEEDIFESGFIENQGVVSNRL